MYKTKKEVDAHVHKALAKIRPGPERDLRGLTIAKLYFKINEYAKAEEYLLSYFQAKEDNDQAHKLLAQCYKQLKKPEKALQSYQRSLQLNPKQADVLIEVCQLLVEDSSTNASKAKYWCDLAESAKVNHDAVFALRLKVMDKDEKDAQPLEELIMKEISARPNDISVRISLLRNYIEKQKLDEAFKYAFDLELTMNDHFTNSSDWYNAVWQVLSKYELLKNSKKGWEFWTFAIKCLERQVSLSLGSSVANISDAADLLFKFDQYLYKFDEIADKLNTQRELIAACQDHYRGQLLLHMVSLLFKRELLQNKNKWKETVHTALPLLLMGYHIDKPDARQSWLKHCNEQAQKIVQLWTRESAFRAAQLGRILLSCVVDEKCGKENDSVQFSQLLGNQSAGLWENCDDLLSLVRQICTDKNWRHNIFPLIFTKTDQKTKDGTSLFVQSPKMEVPFYEWPNVAIIEENEELAQQLQPSSLSHHVYLCLGVENLSDIRAKYFMGLNFSTQNLNFCGAESLNQLDIDSFLYATVLQAKRQLEVERDAYDSYNSGNRNAIAKPRMLPYINVASQLCTDEQAKWWMAAFKVYKNLSNHSSLSELRTQLQLGIEAVRGINGPRADLYIVFKLGQLLVTRSQGFVKPIEKTALEARAESLYKQGLNMLKKHQKGQLEPFGKYFKYAKSQTASVERAIKSAAEDAVSYIGGRYFKKSLFEEFIDELDELQLPTATYMQAEAYRKLDEASKTPRKSKCIYLDRRNEYLQKTQQLLKNDREHPLSSLISGEIKRLHQSSNINKNHYGNDSFNSPLELHNNSSNYEDAEEDFYAESIALNRTRRDTASSAALATAQRNIELENLVKQMAANLNIVKQEIIDSFKPQLTNIQLDIATLNDKVAQIEEGMKKTRISSEPPSRDDDASQVLDDLYLIEDVLQTPMYQSSSQTQQQQQQHSQQSQPATHFPNMYNGAGSSGSSFVRPTQHPHTPVQQQDRFFPPNPAGMHPMLGYNSPMFQPNPNALSYYSPQPQFMMPPQGPGAVPPPNMLGQRNSNFPLNMYTQQQSFLDATNSLNFNMAQQLTANQLGQPPMPSLVTPSSSLSTTAVPNVQQDNIAPAPPIPVPTAAANVPVVATSAQSVPTHTLPVNVLFNKALNNQPVEKGPPANVVITSSDPLPKPSIGGNLNAQQPTLSVTIPPQHIKPSVVAAPEPTATVANVSVAPPTAAIGSFNFSLNNTANTFKGFGTIATSTTTTSHTGASMFGSNVAAAASAATPAPAAAPAPAPVAPISTNTFSFKSQIAQAAAEKAKEQENNSLNDSHSSDVNKSFGADPEVEYDPRPDFQPIIPLPDEIEVKTGEEDEEVMFCYLAKLYRLVDKEWKERGKGDIKILKNKQGLSRILMRREQTHKICANHSIAPEMSLTQPEKETKALIWAANDFADEEVRLEKFFVRFKLPETAEQFKNAFNAAKEEAAQLKKQTTESNNKVTSSMVESTTTTTAKPFALSKSNAVNNFVTSTPAPVKTDATGGGLLAKPTNVATAVAPSTPISKAPIPAAANPPKSLFGSIGKGDAKVSTTTDSTATKPAATNAPFANFSFGASSSFPVFGTPTAPTTTASNSPFAHIFNNLKQGGGASPFATPSASSDNSSFSTPIAKPQVSLSTATNDTLLNQSTADPEEEFVPTAEFQPVIALPDLVEVNTGEENDIILFEYRAKLLRFNKETSEWKERGLGNIKLLQNKDDVNVVRLVMRREQVHKLCCNQRLLKETKFNYAKNSKTALTWVGQDFSEEELTTETLCVRFKTEETCKQFLDAVLKAQSQMTDKETAEVVAETEKPKEKTTTTTVPAAATKGFGDAFKPKSGAWSCDACYISNDANQLYCVACDSPKDNTVPKKEEPTNGLNLTTNTKFSFGFNSVAASTPAQPTTTPAISTAPPKTAPAPPAAIATSNANAQQKTTSGFGDAFKPKVGSWNCNECYLSNKPDALYCQACQAPKDDTVPKKEEASAGVLSLTSVGPAKFNFGFNNASAAHAAKPPFSFGAPAVNAVPPTATKSEPVKNLFGSLATAKPEASQSFTFTPPTASSTGFGMDGVTKATLPVLESSAFTFNMANKPATTDASNAFSLDKKDFNFTMKPKSPGKGQKTQTDVDDDGTGGGDDEYEEEENSTYFTPVIPLPDKIDVKTGEEDEEMLYVHRAKLYRLAENEWKERGLGDVKILRHKGTKKLRVVMRREQVLKICLNHALNESVGYKAKDDKSWLFVVHDFSEGESTLERFTLRFKNPEIAQSFLDAVKRALDGTAVPITATSEEGNKNSNDLSLPGDFLTKETPCAGCRGCNSDDFILTTVESNEGNILLADLKTELPMQQPALTLPIKLAENTTVNTSNRSLIKPGAFSGNATLLGTSNAASTAENDSNLFKTFSSASSVGFSSGGDGDKASNGKVDFSFTAALNNSSKPFNTENGNKFGSSGGFLFGSGDDKKADADNSFSLFGNTEAKTTDSTANGTKSIFGVTSKPSIGGSVFGGNSGSLFGNTNTASTTNTTTGSTSIFGGTGSTVFGSGATIGGSIFGGANAKPVFGEPPTFGGSGKSIFGKETTTTGSTPLFGSTQLTTTFGDTANKSDAPQSNTIFGSGGATFADIANKTTTVSFGSIAKTNPSDGKNGTAAAPDFNALATKAASSDDFASLAAKAGNDKPKPFQSSSTQSPGGFIGLTHQDAFQSFLKPSNSTNTSLNKNNDPFNKSTGEKSDADDNEENYDPHYEPIIPLPQEIVVVTGEEDETKLFGERATLYRWDGDTKQWKERGVGELKILSHPQNHTYRLLLRREQILKLVLNHAINADFVINVFNNNSKSFIWAAVNYAESQDGETERLAVRFKKEETANAFINVVKDCIEKKKREQQ